MVKTIDDYIEAVQEKFPFLSKRAIRWILNKGFRRISFILKVGVPVSLLNNTDEERTTIRIGTHIPSVKRSIRCNTVRRILQKEIWDGYYYIPVQEETHKELLKQRGSKRFKNALMFKYKRDVRDARYVWRIYYPADMGDTYVITYLKTKNAEFYGK